MKNKTLGGQPGHPNFIIKKNIVKLKKYYSIAFNLPIFAGKFFKEICI